MLVPIRPCDSHVLVATWTVHVRQTTASADTALQLTTTLHSPMKPSSAMHLAHGGDCSPADLKLPMSVSDAAQPRRGCAEHGFPHLSSPTQGQMTHLQSARSSCPRLAQPPSPRPPQPWTAPAHTAHTCRQLSARGQQMSMLLRVRYAGMHDIGRRNAVK